MNVDNRYGAIPMDIEKDVNIDSTDDDAYYSNLSRRLSGKPKLADWKCLLSVAMLLTFFILSVSFTGVILFDKFPVVEQGIRDHQYDYIVVGAGPAGSTIVSKLVRKGYKVLLLEAGGRTQYDLGGTDSFGGPLSRFDIPLLWSSMMTNKSIHWTGYNIHGIVQGKGLGGSGIHSAMIYIRSLEADLKKWNLQSWTWERMLQHYIALEDFDSVSGEPVPYFHGRGGPLRTTKAPYIDLVAPAFIQSAQHLGHSYTNDFNNPMGRCGVGYYDFNIRNGLRDSAASRLLGPILNQKPSNFELQLDSVVKRVLFKTRKESSINPKNTPGSTSKRQDYYTVGLEYEQHGETKTVYLRSTRQSGVILAASALLTPKILMNSGIGPSEVLNNAGVNVKVESPRVGENAQDHGATQVLFRLKPDVTGAYPLAYNVLSKFGQYVDNVERAKKGETISPEEFGVLGSSGLAAGAFLVSPFSEDGVPDIQLTVFPSNIFDHGKESSIKPPVSPWGNVTTPVIPPSTNVMVIAVALMNPETRFKITLNATDSFAPPIITSTSDNVIEQIDLLKMAWGIEQVRTIAKVAPLSDFIEEILAPASDITSDMLPTWIVANHHPYAHWVGSAALGSVVDENAKVYGVDGLYVGDASIMPLLTNGNIHSTVVAVASQVADLILREE